MKQRTGTWRSIAGILGCVLLAGCHEAARNTAQFTDMPKPQRDAITTFSNRNRNSQGKSVRIAGEIETGTPANSPDPLSPAHLNDEAVIQLLAWEESAAEPPAALLPTPDEEANSAAGVIIKALSVAELQRRALANNPTLRQADAFVRQARGNWLQVGLYPNPKLQAQQAANNSALDMFNVFVTQPIVTGHKLQLNRDVASYDVQRSEWEAEAQCRRVMNEVHLRFIAALGAQRQVAAAEELLKISEEGVRTTERQMEGEQVSEADVLQARLQFSETQILLRNARIRAAATWIRLGNVIGEPDLPVSPLEGTLEDEVPPLDWESSCQQLLSHHPLIHAVEARVAAARAQVEREAVQRKPNLNLTAGLGRDFFTPQYMMYTLNFAVTPPAWNKNQGNLTAATGLLHTAMSELNRLELSLRNNLALAFQRYQSARNEVDVYRQLTIPIAEGNLSLAETAYEQGEFGFLRVLTARRDLFTARINSIDALTALRTSVIEIEGLLLTGGLEPLQSHPIPSNSAGKTADQGRP